MVSTHASSAKESVICRWIGKQTFNYVPHAYVLKYNNLNCKHRYKIHIKVKDNGVKTTLVLFNGVAEKFLYTSAFKLVNQLSRRDMQLPSQREALLRQGHSI